MWTSSQAGLFSAVVTTFLVQVSTQLQPDYVQLSSSIMYELLVVQRMIGNGSSVDINPIVPSPDAPFHPAREIVWVNGLWYTSLSLSLVTALVASLAKQWLHQYMAMSSGSARERCLIRQYRCDGYYQWGIPFIIGALPVLLHMSLGLFFAGLTVYLVQLYFPLAILACSLAGMTYAGYFASHVLSALNPQCPYKTPLSNVLFVLKHRALALLKDTLLVFFETSLSPLKYVARLVYHALPDFDPSRSLREAESAQIRSMPGYAIDVLSSLSRTTANNTARSLILQALGGFPEIYAPQIRLAEGLTLTATDVDEVYRLVRQLNGVDDEKYQAHADKLERILRTAVITESRLSTQDPRDMPSLVSTSPKLIALAASAFWHFEISPEVVRIVQSTRLLLHPLVWLRLLTKTFDTNHPVMITADEPGRVSRFFHYYVVLRPATHSVNRELSDLGNAVTYTDISGTRTFEWVMLDVLHNKLALKRFDYWSQGGAPPKIFKVLGRIQANMGVRIRTTLLNYYCFMVTHEDLYEDLDFESIQDVITEVLIQCRVEDHSFAEFNILLWTLVPLFTELDLPRSWSDLDHVRQDALQLVMDKFEDHQDLCLFHGGWFSRLFISSLLEPVISWPKTSPSVGNAWQYMLPALTMVETGIIAGLPEAFEHIRSNNLLRLLFPYHRYHPVSSLLTRYITLSLDSGMLNSDQRRFHWQFISTGQHLARVTVLVLSLPSNFEYAVAPKTQPDMYRTLLNIFSGRRGELDTEAWTYVKDLITIFLDCEDHWRFQSYWSNLRIFDEVSLMLRDLNDIEKRQLREQLRERWQLFSSNLDRMRKQHRPRATEMEMVEALSQDSESSL